MDGRAQAELFERPGCQAERARAGADAAGQREQAATDHVDGIARRRAGRETCRDSAKTAPAKTAPAKTAPARTAAAKTAAKVAPKPAVTQAASTAQRVALVKNALRDHKVVAVLFYNPAAADDRAVKRELAAIPTHGGKVVKLAVPLSELAQYPVITNQVQVTDRRRWC